MRLYDPVVIQFLRLLYRRFRLCITTLLATPKSGKAHTPTVVRVPKAPSGREPAPAYFTGSAGPNFTEKSTCSRKCFFHVIVAQKCNFLNRVIFACDLFDTQIIPLIFDFVKGFCKKKFEFFEFFSLKQLWLKSEILTLEPQ